VTYDIGHRQVDCVDSVDSVDSVDDAGSNTSEKHLAGDDNIGRLSSHVRQFVSVLPVPDELLN
jgi:hypothetical protein